MPLADALGKEHPAPVRVVAVRAGEVHLPDAAVVERPTRLEARARRAFDRRRDRHAARLMGDVRVEREQLLRLPRRPRRALAVRPALDDAIGHVHEPARRAVDRRIARRDASHRGARIAVAVGARFPRRSRRRGPEFRAALDPQHAGIREVVLLLRAQLRAEEGDAGLELVERNRALLRTGKGAPRYDERDGGAGRPARRHPVTRIGWRADSCTPASSIQANSSVPLVSATVVNCR